MFYDREKRRKYYLAHKEEAQEGARKYREEHREGLKQAARDYYLTHKVESKERVTRNRKKRKIEALIHYGNGVLACVRCGFDDIRALTIDHINNNGAEHRRELFGRNKPDPRLGSWLRARDYPDGYQTLCMNCQFIKEAERREGTSTGT